MNEPKLQLNRMHGLMILGVVCMITGTSLIVAGVILKKPEAKTTDNQESVLEQSQPQITQVLTYRLKYADGDNRWELNDTKGNRILLLPEFLPGPGFISPPHLDLELGEIGSFLIKSMDRNQIKITTAQYKELALIEVEGESFFDEAELKRLLENPARAPSVEKPKPKRAEVAKSQTKTEVAEFPSALNPEDPAFAQHLNNWQQMINPALAKTQKGRLYLVTYSDAEHDGKEIQLPFSKNAHRRVELGLKADNKQHQLIFLQVQAVRNGFKLSSLDGMWGKNTERALRQCFTSLGNPEKENAYINLIKQRLGVN